ncbi:MAG TPA: ABC transporter ATP-binding protein [Marmoricola sp.]
MPLIEFEGVAHDYVVGATGGRPVVHDLDLRLDEHRIAVIGGNGSGKSTFARMLNALIVPTSGTVRVDGLDTAKDARAVRRKVGFCFTDPDAQIVMPTVAEDVAFGLRRRGLSKHEIAERVDSVLSRFGLAGHRDHPAHLLSGGQKQLLALASVLVTTPQLLVMDEPTTLLDLANTRILAETVRDLDEQVVVVSHDLEFIADFDRVLVFADGAVVCDDKPALAVRHYRALVESR